MTVENDFVGAGTIVGLHGVKGIVKFRSDLEDSIEAYTIYNHEFEEVEFEVTGYIKDCLLIKIKGVETRDDARFLLQKSFYIKKSSLPKINEAEVFYYHELIGLKVQHNNKDFGVIQNVYSNSIYEIIEIVQVDGKLSAYTFTHDNFPKVDLVNNIIQINLDDSEVNKVLP